MGALPPCLWILRETLANEPAEERRQLGPHRGHRRWIQLKNRRPDARWAVASKRTMPGGHLIEHRTKSKDIAARIGRASFDLLWRHIRRGAKPGPLRRERRGRPRITGIAAGRDGLCALGQPEVEQLHARRCEHHIAGLQVTMDDALAMRGSQGDGHLAAVAQELAERQAAIRDACGQRFAVEQLHHEVFDAVRVSDIEERTDIRMRETRDGARFLLESLARRSGIDRVEAQHLDGDKAIEARISRLVDLAHSPGPECGDDFVGPQASAGRESHW